MAVAKTIRKSMLGKHNLRLASDGSVFSGLADGSVLVTGDDAEDVWRRLQDEAGKSDPRYFGYEGARSCFLKFFPNGFHSVEFESKERDYKIAAKAKLDASAPLEEALTGCGFGEAILAVFQATNLLSPFEKARLQDLLRGDDADAFIQAAAKFTVQGSKSSLQEIDRVLRPHEAAKWTVATYLPYLWRPETHMFLKPEVTKDFATRVGHRLASIYQAQLDIEVYETLLELAHRTTEILSDFCPRDRIDIQSFIWIIGAYWADSEDIDP